MKKLFSGIVLALLVIPAPGFAWHWGAPRRTVVRHHHHGGTNGAAIAAGVLGGIATGIIIDRVFFPPAPRVVVERDHPSPPPRPRDPYDTGYSDGYGEGVERGRYERYDQGRRRGYEEGYEDARTGRGR